MTAVNSAAPQANTQQRTNRTAQKKANSAAAKTKQSANQSQKSRQILSKDMKTFLNLLTTQLKNQDPTSPMDTNKFTQQLTQFSGIEQQIHTNKHLEKLVAMQGSDRQLRGLDYVGARIEAVGNTNMLGKTGDAEWLYALPKKAAKVTIEVRDQKNNVVYTEKRTNQSGRKEFIWDGNNAQGERMPPGAYTMVVKATDADGKKVSYTPGIRGQITSVDFVKDDMYARIGDIKVKFDSIVNVKRPTAPAPQSS